ncbi:UNVERIFIED_CONTAM: hypothetical protein GTU68_025917, partial [Idotea baltica]|nr:hypothetical protein [Idotea baltica]
AVFLDRDGVLNRKQPPSTYVTNPGELDVLAGVGKAVRRLNDAGYRSIVVTNQRGIGRGLMSESDLDAIHQKLVAEIAVDGAVLDEIRHCPHDYSSRCRCRKPAPGMVLDAIAEHDIDRAASILIGDSDSDIAAAAAAGIDGIFIGDAAEVEHWPSDAARPVAIHHDLPAAVDWFLSTVSARSSHQQQRQTEDSK